jgi:hypothetical protein
LFNVEVFDIVLFMKGYRSLEILSNFLNYIPIESISTDHCIKNRFNRGNYVKNHTL